jgi:hypothetical protein
VLIREHQLAMQDAKTNDLAAIAHILLFCLFNEGMTKTKEN